MKSLFVSGCILLLLPLTVFSQDTETDLLEDIGNSVSPNSPFYFLDVWFDDMRVNNANNNIERARIRLEIAQERVVEAQEMIQANNEKGLARALAERDEEIVSLEVLQEGIEDETAKVEIQERLMKHVMTLEQVKEKAPEAAQNGLATAISNSNKVMERTQAKIQSQNRLTMQEMRQNVEQNKVQFVTQIKTGTQTINQVSKGGSDSGSGGKY